jgi:hypothetical protein
MDDDAVLAEAERVLDRAIRDERHERHCAAHGHTWTLNLRCAVCGVAHPDD